MQMLQIEKKYSKITTRSRKSVMGLLNKASCSELRTLTFYPNEIHFPKLAYTTVCFKILKYFINSACFMSFVVLGLEKKF